MDAEIAARVVMAFAVWSLDPGYPFSAFAPLGDDWSGARFSDFQAVGMAKSCISETLSFDCNVSWLSPPLSRRTLLMK